MKEQNEPNKFKAEEIPCQEISDPAVLSKNPLISVRMSTYNHEPYIAQAIEGVLKQETGYPFELIIGEDCSTDRTREIVLEYQRKYPAIIRVIAWDKNVGMKKNGRRTIEACRGKYMAICEGDDYWHNPEKLHKQADHLESHPECGLVYSSYDVYHVSTEKLIKDYIKYRNWQMPETPCLSDFFEEKVEIGYGILTCTVMVRRKLYNQIIESDPYLHQSGQFLMGDTQLWAEISTMAQLHYIPESMATHNITDESATRSKDVKKVLRFEISGAELMLCLCDKYNLLSSRDKYERSWCDSSLRLAFETRNVKLANEVRRKKKEFTRKEWLMYYGVKNLAFYYVYRIAALFRNLFKKKHNQWS